MSNVTPTLGTDVSSLPPEGALEALGRPGGGSAVASAHGVNLSKVVLQARGLTKGLATLCIGGGEATAVALELM